jgi:hypothetical protein
MPILHVRNVPDDLYARIQQLASNQNRSMSALKRPGSHRPESWPESAGAALPMPRTLQLLTVWHYCARIVGDDGDTAGVRGRCQRRDQAVH